MPVAVLGQKEGQVRVRSLSLTIARTDLHKPIRQLSPLCVVAVLEMVPGLYVLGCSQAELGSQRVDTRIKLSAFERH